MNICNFFNITTVNDKQEFDYLYNNFSKFVMTYQPAYYRVEIQDVMRPDLISYKAYKSVQYWWVIMMVNNIQDVITGINVGTLLKIPSILDIYTFVKRYSVR